MDPLTIIDKYYCGNQALRRIFMGHAEWVAEKSVRIGRKILPPLKPDLDFLYEAAMLHDIGIFLTSAPQIECLGDQPYIRHGCLGRELLEKEGFPGHALVAERHVGAGLTAREIVEQKLPLPVREMAPQTLEEKIIAFADKFHSKGRGEKTLEQARESIGKHGEKFLAHFNEWVRLFYPFYR